MNWKPNRATPSIIKYLILVLADQLILCLWLYLVWEVLWSCLWCKGEKIWGQPWSSCCPSEGWEQIYCRLMNLFKPCHKTGTLLYLIRGPEKEEIGPKPSKISFIRTKWKQMNNPWWLCNNNTAIPTTLSWLIWISFNFVVRISCSGPCLSLPPRISSLYYGCVCWWCLWASQWHARSLVRQ